MNKTELMTKFTRTFNKTKLKVRKHSPEILVVSGIVGVVVSGVMACKATTKIGEVLDDAKEKVDNIHKAVDRSEELSDEAIRKLDAANYNEEDGKKDLAIVYAQTSWKLVKLYWPSVVLGLASIGSILYSHRILSKRNMALAAAYTAIDKGFKEYRERVVERFGQNVDKELRYNIKAQEITETVTDENGKEKTVTKTVDVIEDPNKHSIYARFFDETCLGWAKDAEVNFTFLKLQMSHANKILQERGYLFLNEVYDMLGIQKTAAGQVVGWVYDEKNPIGDNFVDFGIFDIHQEKVRNFVNGLERSILLDFNVDGNILQYI